MRSPLAAALWSQWTVTQPEAQDYTYCLLALLITAHLFWKGIEQLRRLPLHGSNAALAWMGLGFFVFIIAAKAGRQSVGCVGLQMLLAGIILWFGGATAFRTLLFPWAFLAFCWPWPFIDTAIAFPLRMMVSHLSYDALNLVGIPCIQNGTLLFSSSSPSGDLPAGAQFQIDVADPCSGIHSLVALTMVATLYGHFIFRKKILQQWTIFFAAFPFAILGNVVRIFLLVGAALKFGTPFAIGTTENPSIFHEIGGFAVFAVLLGLECLLAHFLLVLERRGGWSRKPAAPGSPSPVGANFFSPAPAETTPGESGPPRSISQPRAREWYWRSGVIFGFSLLTLVIIWISPPPFLPPQPGVIMSLPDEVGIPAWPGGKFFGFPAEVSEVEHQLLPKDTEFARKNYDDFHGHQIFFSIVLSGTQQALVHPPQVCLVAQGWNIVDEKNVSFPLSSGHQLTVRNLSLQRFAVDRSNQKHLVRAYYMYWYVAENETTPSQFDRSLITSRDRIFYNVDHRWAYVIAMSIISNTVRPDGLDAGQTRDMLTAFIRQILPEVQKSEMPAEFGKR